MNRIGATGDDLVAPAVVLREGGMKERLGWMLLVLAAIALLANIRLPAKPASVTITATGPAANAAPVPVEQGTIPVNSADAALLDTLPGIGKAYAQAIIDERMAYGPYFYPEDVIDVKGIGVKRLEAIYDMLDLSPSE